MSGVLLHDGRVIGHRKWCVDAVRGAVAQGMIISPFTTPRVSRPRHPGASVLANDMNDLHAEFIFDPMTHARLLPLTDRVEFYNEWELWPPSGVSLKNTPEIIDHVERVFAHQDTLSAPYLAPTIQLSNPTSSESSTALEIARVSRGIAPNTWQSLVGTRAFWSAGADLDAFVGSLATLKAPTWLLTVANDVVIDSVPDLRDIKAFEGFCRTVRSLSLRARVIVCYADYAGLPAVAAGADTVGTGWHRAQKMYDPKAFHIESDPGIRRQASYVTQGLLHAVLRRDTADQITRWNAVRANVIRGGPMPRSDGEERMHHLRLLTAVIQEIDANPSHRKRFEALDARYAVAASTFDELVKLIPAISNRDKESWNTAVFEILRTYAAGEGFTP